ncbi:MAG TPA: hypothetical protein VKC61_07670 [Pyrinomonadaceae bacterium]|nr:hypothetical protein [Pyrinomonadaceae bacterium]
MSDGSGEIIIKGGSVKLDFDESVYKKNPSDPKKHENANRRITEIVIVDENGAEQFNSGNKPNGLKWTITVSTK